MCLACTVQYFSVQLLLHSTLYYLRSDVDFELFFPLNNDNTCPVLCILISTQSKSAVSFDVLFMRSERCLDLPYDPHSMCDKCKHPTHDEFACTRIFKSDQSNKQPM